SGARGAGGPPGGPTHRGARGAGAPEFGCRADQHGDSRRGERSGGRGRDGPSGLHRSAPRAAHRASHSGAAAHGRHLAAYHPPDKGESTNMATPMLQNFIDGRWLDASGGGTFENTNPATGELIANVAKSTVADVDTAVDTARRALDGWRLYPAPKRGEILYRAGE